MKKMLVVPASVAVSICMGQYLETVIPLADSLSTWYVWSMFYNPGSNTVWVGEDSTVVFDAASGEKLMLVPRGFYADCYNPVSDKFYLASDSLYVYDGASNVQLAALDLMVDQSDGKERVMVHDPVGNKLYTTVHHSDSIAVICGDGDTLIRKVYVEHGSAVLEYNATNRKIYSLARFYGVSVIDPAADTVVAYVRAPGGCYQPMAWSVQSNKLYVGNDWGVDVIDGVTDSFLIRIPHRNNVQWLKYNTNNDRVYAATLADVVVSIDCATDSILTEINPPGVEVYSTYCSPDANKVYVADWRNRVVIIDCTADTVVAIERTGAQDSDVAMCHSAVDNKAFIACEDGGSVAVIDGESDQVETVVISNRFDPRDPCHVETRDRIYILDYSIGGLSVIDCATNELVGTKNIGMRPDGVAADALGRKLYVVDRETRQLSVVSTDTDSLVGVVPTSAWMYAPMFTNPRTGKLYCDASFEGRGLAVVDTDSDSVLSLVETLRYPDAFVLSSVSNQVYVSSDDTTMVVVVDGAGDTVSGYIMLAEPPRCLGYSRSPDRVFAMGVYGLLSVIDCGSNSVVDEANVPMTATIPLWNPVANKLYYRTVDDTLCIVDCRTGEVTAQLKMGEYPTPRLCDTLANKVYVTAGGSTVWFLDGDTDSVVGEVEVPGRPWDMAWCPGRRRVYVCCAPSTVAVLKDTVTGIAADREIALRQGFPTVVRRMLPLSGKQAVDLLDIAGRRVMELQPGNNDIRSVSPGVYFVAERSAVSGRRSAVRKIVIQR